MTYKRVLLIRNAAPQDFGGGERFPVFLAEVLHDNNVETIIISRSKKLLQFAKSRKQATITGWWWKKQQWSGANNILLPLYFIWQIVLLTHYIILFKKLKPIAVHIQSKDDFIAATYAAHLLKIPAVWTDHADLKHIWKNLSVPYKNPIGKSIYKAADKAAAITVVSKSEKSLVTAHLPANSNVLHKIKVIYNGVTDTAKHYESIKSSKSTLPVTFLVASRLVTDKGIGEAIAAFKKLHAHYENTQLILIGDGPERDVFKKQAEDTKAIVFLGHQTDPLKFMRTADVFIHPTYHEGFSVALVEAGMMSLPIVATAVGGNTEIMEEDKTGLLIPAKNADMLYYAMEKLYKNPNLRDRLGEAARKQYLRNFQFDNIVKKSFIPLYESES